VQKKKEEKEKKKKGRKETPHNNLTFGGRLLQSL
jgi:hypothetical protein